MLFRSVSFMLFLSFSIFNFLCSLNCMLYSLFLILFSLLIGFLLFFCLLLLVLLYFLLFHQNCFIVLYEQPLICLFDFKQILLFYLLLPFKLMFQSILEWEPVFIVWTSNALGFCEGWFFVRELVLKHRRILIF